jgi:Uma2 family endonuclease
MSTATLGPPTTTSTLTTRELLDRVGDVPLFRICFDPFPGTATEQDVVDARATSKRLFELVDGVLVEKAMGAASSYLTSVLMRFLTEWVMTHNLGMVFPPDGMLRLAPGLVRIPDVTFIPWSRVPGRQLSLAPTITALFPELAVEVLSPSNTPSEMAQKRQEYFTAGTRLVWIVDPRTRTVQVFTSPTASILLQEGDTLAGDPVLPGFSLPLAALFAELDPH